MAYSVEEIANKINGKVVGNKKLTVDKHFFDSRNIIESGQGAFWALKGKIDAHVFIMEAYKKGVRVMISSKEVDVPEDAALIVVDNPNHALQVLAKDNLARFPMDTIGITGSNGKTIVKEWLFQTLVDHASIIRSPKSYNSQIGLPISILGANDSHNLGIFEVGISEKGEMENLQHIFQPTIGVLTNVLRSHLENFESYDALVQEKLTLFKDTSFLVYNVELQQYINTYTLEKHLSFGLNSGDVHIANTAKKDNGLYDFEIQLLEEKLNASFSFSDRASLENLCCVVATLSMLGYDASSIELMIEKIHPIEMRLEIKNAYQNSVLIRDEFSLDYSSLEIGLSVLNQQFKTNKIVILTDFDAQETNEEQYIEVINLLNNSQVNMVFYIGNEILPYQSRLNMENYVFPSLEDFISQMRKFDFSNSAILIKGARKFGLEKLSKELEVQSHDTIMEVSLHNLVNNYNYFKGKLESSTLIMGMVKANAYGLGITEVSQTLQHYGVNYLGVAYADEGEQLRKNGIYKPIMVMNPEQSSYSKIIDNQLEPEIYSFRVLKRFIDFLKSKSTNLPYPIHIKIDTGMHRLGFLPTEIKALKNEIEKNPYVQVVSIFSHLSSSGDLEENEFTISQIELFEKCYSELSENLHLQPLKHLLNSNGVLNYPEYQFDMVRVGIGLYDNSIDENLNLVVSLKTVLSQIKEVKKGDSVGYDRAFIAEKDMNVGILPIGYADGVNRNIGLRNFHISINDTLCPVIGLVCMDMLMVDVSGVDCKEGDEVIIFGNRPKISDYAHISNTNTYDCLTSISNRIKRVYFKE